METNSLGSLTDETRRDLRSFTTFEPGTVYVFVGLARNKDNPAMADSTKLVRETAQTSAQISTAIERLEARASRHEHRFRLYMSINRRDALEASFLLRERMDNWFKHLYAGDDELLAKFGRLGSEFRSCLQHPSCKDEGHFLIDIDEPGPDDTDELRDLLTELTTVRLERETPNGYHFVVNGFNPNELARATDIEYERKNDGLVFLNWLSS